MAWAAPLLSHLIAVAHLPFLLSVFAVTYRRHGADCSPAIHRLFIVGNALIVAAFACWLLDRFACCQISAALPFYPQLHAWWHVFVSGGLYFQEFGTMDLQAVIFFAGGILIQLVRTRAARLRRTCMNSTLDLTGWTRSDLT